MRQLKIRPPQTEKEWQSTVTEYAKLMGWKHYHTHDSRRSAPGFPDLILLRPPRMIAIELKSEKGQPPTMAQREWLEAFAACQVPTYVWRPSDWPSVCRILGKEIEP